MQKKLARKLNLNRETLRTLTPQEIDGANGGGTTAITIRSNPTDTCDTCVACNISRFCPPSWDGSC